jgi:hypothetical protein
MNAKTETLVDMMRTEIDSAQRKWESCKTRSVFLAASAPFLISGFAGSVANSRALDSPTYGNIATGIAVVGVTYLATECALAIKAYRDLKSAGTIKGAGDVTDQQRAELTKILSGEAGAELRTAAQLTPSQSLLLGNSGAVKRMEPLDRLAIFLTQDNPPISPAEAKQALIEAGLDSKKVRAELDKSDGLDKGNGALIKALAEKYSDMHYVIVSAWKGRQDGHPDGFKGEVQSRAEKTVDLLQSVTNQKAVGQSLMSTLQAPVRPDSSLKSNRADL